jgi:hypothetical protein
VKIEYEDEKMVNIKNRSIRRNEECFDRNDREFSIELYYHRYQINIDAFAKFPSLMISIVDEYLSNNIWYKISIKKILFGDYIA